VKKIVGISLLLVAICLFTWQQSPYFLLWDNIENLLRWSALFGIISIGAAFVIMGRGIDLSIGSVICLVGIMTPWLLVEQGWSVWAVLPFVLTIGVGIGIVHGLLVTRLGLQPFVVTLCGLLFYRGLARGITQDQTQGFRGGYESLRWLASGTIPIPGTNGFDLPIPILILVIVAVVAGVVLHLTVYGRHLLAIGRNESAAKYSGINTDRVVLLSYVICSFLAAVGGLLFVLDVGSAQPVDFGNFYELYAIAAAVLGGCSLRGGEASIIGVIVGAAVMRVLKNSITLIDWIPDNVEYAVIGVVILAGVAADEIVRRAVAHRARVAARTKKE
jgi:ribose transport system permease protein